MDVKDRLFDDNALIIGVWRLSESVFGNAKVRPRTKYCKIEQVACRMRMKSERYRLGLWTDFSEDVSRNVSLAADQDIALRLSVSLKYPGGGWAKTEHTRIAFVTRGVLCTCQ